MTEDIKRRVLEEAKYIFDTHSTIRQTAQVYGLSKSTVHHDISTKLRYIDTSLFVSTREILQKNFEEKHIRGGMATKLKYELENDAI